jgi:hypothetical protein
MSGISAFLSGLSEQEWDVMFQVSQDLQDSTSIERLNSLRQFLQTLSREIDHINRKRDALGYKVDNIDALLPMIHRYLEKNPDDLEIELFKNVLSAWRSSLKSEITSMRPNGKLDKKYDTEQKRSLLIQMSELVKRLNEKIAESNNDSKAQTICTEPASPEAVKK